MFLLIKPTQLFHVLRLLFIRQYMVMIGCAQRLAGVIIYSAVAVSDSCITSLFYGWWTSKSQPLRPRPNDELFMRRTNSLSYVYEKIDVWLS